MKPKTKMNLKSFILKYVYTNLSRLVPDKMYLKRRFRKKTNKRLDLINPKTFSDKINYLKLHPNTPLVHDYSDKLKVKTLVKDIVNTPMTLWEGETITQEVIDKLPEKFVIKSNAYSGDVWLVTDKSELDLKEVNTFYKRIKRIDYHLFGRETSYKGIEKKIFIEEFLDSGNITDYKFFCFNGKVAFCHVITDRFESLTEIMVDEDFKNLGFNLDTRFFNPDINFPKPNTYDEMIKISEEIAKPFDFVRVDLYSVNNELYLGECTFYPWGGMYKILPREKDTYYENKLGDLLNLTK